MSNILQEPFKPNTSNLCVAALKSLPVDSFKALIISILKICLQSLFHFSLFISRGRGLGPAKLH